MVRARESRRPPLPDRLTPAERDFYLELRRLVYTAGYSCRMLEDVTSGNQCFFSKSQWGRWLNGLALPPRRAVRTLADRLAADDIDAGHLIDLWGRAFAPGDEQATVPATRRQQQLHSQLPPLRQPVLSADPAFAGTGPTPAGQGEPQRAMPRELPPAVPGFTGRVAELEALTRLLDRPGAQAPGAVVITAIGGTAGVGKTALAVAWAHQAADRFPDGQLYVNLRGYDPGQPLPATDALAGFLRSLGVPGQGIPPEEDERAARYRSLLAGKRMLVVLDNAGSSDQVRPLLPGTPSCAVLVTSRDALAGLAARDGAARLDLDVLPVQDAVGLLRALIGARVDAEPEAAAALAGQCCRLPLALRVAAELAAARADMPLVRLTAELADLGTRLDLLETGGDPRTQVRTVFSWSYRHLDAEAARVFRLAGLHPGPDLEPYAAAALAGTTLPQARRALNVLARAHLIQPSAPGRYGMHDLLRGYARELSATADGGQEQHAALTRLFDVYLHTVAAAMDTLHPVERYDRPRIPRPATPVPPVGDPAAARDWLDAERAALVAVAGHAATCGWPGHATRLAATFAGIQFNSGQYLSIFRHALDAARRTGDRAAEATTLIQIGNVHWEQGRYLRSAEHFRQALALVREAGDRAGEARALVGLGLAETPLGHCEQAASHHLEAIAIFRDVGDRVGEGTALGDLGWVRRLQGRYEEAAGYCQQELDLFRETGDREAKAWALAGLGAVDLQRGCYQRAAGYLQQAVALFRELGQASSESMALVRLGEVYVGLGRYEQAARNFAQALAVFRETGERFPEAEALNGLGDALCHAGDSGRARAHHAAALEIASEIGERRVQARAHVGLARAYEADGDALLARHHWQEALIRYDALCAPEAREIRARLAAAGGNGDDGRSPVIMIEFDQHADG